MKIRTIYLVALIVMFIQPVFSQEIKVDKSIDTEYHYWTLESIELLADQTICHWSVMSKAANTYVCATNGVYIEDCDTGKKYYGISSTLPLEPEKKILSRQYETLRFVVIFPSIPENVKRINYHSSSSFFIRDIDLARGNGVRNDKDISDDILDAFNEAQRLVSNKDYVNAAKQYRYAAERGFSAAQFYLGLCYLNGYGVDVNFREAFSWLKLAAENADMPWIEAFTPLAYCYYGGLGVTKNLSEALRWYRKGADSGNVEAQYCLGLAYDNGEGVMQDYEEAAKWYLLAAEKGHMGAANNLATLYMRNCAKPHDDRDGMYWLRKAAEGGDMFAQYTLGLRYLDGYEVPKSKTEALKWFRKSAEQGYLKSQMKVAELEN